MVKKMKEIRIGRPSPSWMQTFADLMMQLMIFFVMLFAISAATVEDQLKEIKERFDSYVVETKVEKFVNVVLNEKGLTVSLQNKLMFDSGEADIFDEAKTMLRNLTTILLEYPNNAKIEGHTDNRAIHNEKFPSNWELSTARATNVTRFLLEELGFPPARLSSAGFAEFHPVVANDTPMNRSLNRRVDLVVQRLSLEQMKQIREEKNIRPFDDKKKVKYGLDVERKEAEVEKN